MSLVEKIERPGRKIAHPADVTVARLFLHGAAKVEPA
jgi:hypothetical protein